MPCAERAREREKQTDRQTDRLLAIPDALRSCLRRELPLLELQPGLYEPNGICGEASDETRARCTPKVDQRSQLPSRVEQALLSSRNAAEQIVAVEIRAPRNSGAQEIWRQSSIQGADAFCAGDLCDRMKRAAVLGHVGSDSVVYLMGRTRAQSGAWNGVFAIKENKTHNAKWRPAAAPGIGS